MTRFSVILLFLPVVLCQLSCRKITLKESLARSFSDRNWPIAGGQPARINYHPETVAPPLKHLWTYKASAAISPTLVAVDGVLYLSTLNGRVEAIEMTTGERIGTANTPTNYESACAYSESHLILASRYGDKTLAKYDLRRGKYVWQIDAGDIASEPLVVEDAIYVSALYQHIDRYDSATGEKMWSFETGDQNRSSPALSGKVLVSGCDNGKLYCLDTESGGLHWEMKTASSLFATPAIWEDDIFIGASDGNFYSVQLKDGALRWKFEVGAPLYQSAATDGKRVLFGAGDGQFYCLNAATGEEQWRFRASSSIGTAPLISGEVVYFGSLDRYYYCLRVSDGKELWRFETQGRIRTTPVVWNNFVFGASEDRHLYAFVQTDEAASE